MDKKERGSIEADEVMDDRLSVNVKVSSVLLLDRSMSG